MASQITSKVVTTFQWTATSLVVRATKHCPRTKQTGFLVLMWFIKVSSDVSRYVVPSLNTSIVKCKMEAISLNQRHDSFSVSLCRLM